jgi:hypothetical protein
LPAALVTYDRISPPCVVSPRVSPSGVSTMLL